MRNVCVWVLSVACPIIACWHECKFKDMKDKTLFLQVNQSVTNPCFWDKLRCVYDIVTQIHRIRTWGWGCPCHPEERVDGKPVKCDHQGLQLPHVQARMMEFWSMCQRKQIEPVENDDACSFLDISDAEVREARSHAFKVLYEMSEMETADYFKQPLSLATIRNVSQLSHELLLWQTMKPEDRHRVSNRLFEPSGNRALYWLFRLNTDLVCIIV